MSVVGSSEKKMVEFLFTGLCIVFKNNNIWDKL